MTYKVRKLAERIKRHRRETTALDMKLIYEGPEIVKALTAFSSLRQLAYEVGLSPTYLSQVKNGKVVISPAAFVKLALKMGVK